MSTSQALRLAIALALKTIPCGLHVMAPDCSSWTRISRGTSLRSQVNVHGNIDNDWVSRGSMMIARLPGPMMRMCSLRVALLLYVTTARHCLYIIEQPEGSKDVLFRHPRLDHWSNMVAYVTRQLVQHVCH